MPEDFKFSDNPVVNRFAVDRAILMFGADWKSRADLMFLPFRAGAPLVADRKSGLSLKVGVTPQSLEHYYVACSAKGELQNPLPNTPAVCRFYINGEKSYHAHFVAGAKINPPDGTPATVNYTQDGSCGMCFYINKNGIEEPASKQEIAKRIRTAKFNQVSGLCASSQDIIALRAGVLRCQTAPSVSPHFSQ